MVDIINNIIKEVKIRNFGEEYKLNSNDLERFQFMSKKWNQLHDNNLIVFLEFLKTDYISKNGIDTCFEFVRDFSGESFIYDDSIKSRIIQDGIDMSCHSGHSYGMMMRDCQFLIKKHKGYIDQGITDDELEINDF